MRTNTAYNPFSLKGKRIIVTGASSGIGRQCAIDCSRMGARVIILARNKERMEKTLADMVGDGHLMASIDLTLLDSLKPKIKEIIDEFGPIDGLVNCAGISTTLPFKLMNPDKVNEFFMVNVYSAIELTRLCCGKGIFNKYGGSVIFISSIMAIAGESGKSLYSMTKGALLSASRSLAVEYARKNIRFNTISPGAILTPINKDLPHMANLEARKALEEKHLLGLGETIDISNACIYLLSDASRWITGQNLIVDGGYTVR